MRKTLRRSCDPCAKSKLRCDLLLPQCSRCLKKSPSKLICVYANAPLSSSLTDGFATASTTPSPESEAIVMQLPPSPEILLSNPGIQSFDPFDSYPQTRLPRAHVQRLIQHFLSTIAFQYYPLDLEATSNPFVVSWFPSALADPALFHVSLQTASLDVELRAQKGFKNSDILMADSVSLVRSKVKDPVLAIQDETMGSIVTLAAIELGKGNISVSQMHIAGIKSLIDMRGGIQQVKAASPLTARMVSWVSMIVMQSPQFTTQDDTGGGDGVAPIPQWYEVKDHHQEHLSSLFSIPGLDPAVGDILSRLCVLFHNPECFVLSTTDLHDLTCFILHRILDRKAQLSHQSESQTSSSSESLRYAIALYLLAIHGPTYFSHAQLQYTMALQLKSHLESLMPSLLFTNDSLAIWLVSVGMVASDGTSDCQWFAAQARSAIIAHDLLVWDDVMFHLRKVLWLTMPQAEHLFRQSWERIWATTAI